MQIRIDGWRSGIRFDAAHVIPHHPKCGHLHGHTYALHASMEGETAERGFIADFGIVKDALRAVADRLDHGVLVQTKSPELEVTQRDGTTVFSFGDKRYEIPDADAILLPVEHTSAESLAAYVLDEVLAHVDLPPQVTRLDVGVDETYGKGAWAGRVLQP